MALDPLSLVLAGTQIFSAFQKGQAARDQGRRSAANARLQADIAGYNADLLRRQSELVALGEDFALAKGLFEENRLHDQVGRIGASQEAHFAANHLDPTWGSPLLMMAETAAQGEVDARLIRADAIVEAADAKTRAASIRGQAAGAEYDRLAALMSANQALASSRFNMNTAFLGAGTALLTQGSKLYSQLSGFSRRNEPTSIPGIRGLY